MWVDTFRLLYDGNTVIVGTVTQRESVWGGTRWTQALALHLACDNQFIVIVPLCRTYPHIFILPLWSCGPDVSAHAEVSWDKPFLVPSSEHGVMDAVHLVADCKHTSVCDVCIPVLTIRIWVHCLYHNNVCTSIQQWLAGECPQDCPCAVWMLSYALDICISFIGEANSSFILYRTLWISLCMDKQHWMKCFFSIYSI
jgi:hypothetical protein